MTIYIAGGSNSLMKTGWTSFFTQKHEGTVNLSIGGTTSFAGIFQISIRPEIGPGDIVIWEYALNETNHASPNAPALAALRRFEYFIQLARDRGAALVPVFFKPQDVEAILPETPYQRGLHQLCGHYGLHPFDLSKELRSSLGVLSLPDRCFRDFRHYAHNEEMNGFITAGVSHAMEKAKVPSLRKPIFTNGEKLNLVTSFTNDIFSNSILSLEVATPPIRIQMTEAGEMVAAVYLAQKGDPESLSFSIVGKDSNPPLHIPLGLEVEVEFPLLKARALRGRSGAATAFRSGDVVRIERSPSWPKRQGDFPKNDAADNAMRWNRPSGKVAGLFIVVSPSGRTARRANVWRVLKRRLSRLVRS